MIPRNKLLEVLPYKYKLELTRTDMITFLDVLDVIIQSPSLDELVRQWASDMRSGILRDVNLEEV